MTYRWRTVRRALTVALVATLTLLWQWASWSGNRAISIVYIVAALAYVACAAAGTVLMSGWVRRHRAVVIVTALVTQRYRTGPGGLWRRYVVPRLWTYAREGDIQHYAFHMPVGVTLSLLNRWREVMEQALDRGVDWRYDRGL